MDSRDTEDRRQRIEDREKQKQKQKQEQKHRQKQWIPAIQRTEDRGQRKARARAKGWITDRGVRGGQGNFIILID